MADRTPAPAFTPATDATAAAWVISDVREDYSVGAIVPGGFAAYARVFHPATVARDGREVAVRWGEVAAANARIMHGAAEWGSIAGSWVHRRANGTAGQEGIWDRSPKVGSLPTSVADALVRVLAPHTAAPERCWFGVWEGRGPLAAALNDAARVRLPLERTMLLLRGEIGDAAASPYASELAVVLPSVNIWWPDDNAWCVATEIDLMSTYVGGSTACIEAILTDPSLEAYAVPVEQGVTWDTDVINPLPPPPTSIS